MVGSEQLRDKLKISPLKARVFPMGADCPDVAVKQFDSLHLLYVGTLERRIDDTIEGFARFYEDYHDQLDLRYTIVGDGRHGERSHLAGRAGQLGIQSVVELPGYIPHDRLGVYWASCNVGVSYVPITTYFDHQPPTKTFEYLLAGMPVIATGTTANREIITDSNGIIIPDTAPGFYRGLRELVQRRGHYDSEVIKQSVAEYTWDHIMSKKVIPYLEDIGKSAGPRLQCLDA
jgi:glycosyltransferase involved in cell wall biosynthesis